jgi:hypothetical protein
VAKCDMAGARRGDSCASASGLAALLAFAVTAHAQSPQTFQYANITTDTTTVLKTGPGVLHSVCVNTATATGVIKIYDSTAGSGPLISFESQR